MVNALVSVDGVELVGELQLTTLEYLQEGLPQVLHDTARLPGCSVFQYRTILFSYVKV